MNKIALSKITLILFIGFIFNSCKRNLETNWDTELVWDGSAGDAIVLNNVDFKVLSVDIDQYFDTVSI